MNDKLLVVLDLDETLFFSDEQPLARKEDFRMDDYYVYKRPGVDAFLSDLSSDDRFALSVWTTATQDYAEKALSNLCVDIDSLAFLYSRKKCIKRYESLDPWSSCNGEYRFMKDLTKPLKHIPWDLSRVIAIDDNPSFYSRQYSNLIAVDIYDGEESQPGLFPALLDYLGKLHALDNVRTEDKRRWFDRFYDNESEDDFEWTCGP